MNVGSRAVEAVDGAWDRFRTERASELDGWLHAEAEFAGGAMDIGGGDRLLAAEAALQRAIVDFAASLDGHGDPTPMALALLRRAENLLQGRD